MSAKSNPKSPKKPNTNMTWRDAIMSIMKENPQTAANYNDITDEIIKRGLRKEFGATPSNTVYNLLNEEFKQKGSNAAFVKVGAGLFMLSTEAGGGAKPTSSSASSILSPLVSEEEEESVGMIQAFGMFWRREAIKWKNKPQIYGQQDPKSEKVDFGEQRGVYLLYDGPRTVYIGKVAEQGLGTRLYQHTIDRLNGRWDRFSWFGLSRVKENGKLEEQTEFKLTPALLIATLEALLIEAVEPSLNRKRGEDFRAIEYLQTADPSIDKEKSYNLLEKAIQQMKELS